MSCRCRRRLRYCCDCFGDFKIILCSDFPSISWATTLDTFVCRFFSFFLFASTHLAMHTQQNNNNNCRKMWMSMRWTKCRRRNTKHTPEIHMVFISAVVCWWFGFSNVYDLVGARFFSPRTYRQIQAHTCARTLSLIHKHYIRICCYYCYTVIISFIHLFQHLISRAHLQMSYLFEHTHKHTYINYLLRIICECGSAYE